MSKYIDAEAFREALYKETADYSELEQRSGEDYSWLWRKAFYRVFNSFPTADVVEVRHGKWIDDCYDQMDGGAYMITVCSVCGTPNPVSNYCPNCGAKMNSKE